MISSADISVMGTTGIKPRSDVPPKFRVTKFAPINDQTTTSVRGRGGGAGMTSCMPATPATEMTTHTVAASAPLLVLRFQKSAAVRSVERAANTESAY